MRHLDLFSGIGGFALAASWTWPDHEVVAFCEIDEYCHRVLGRHWPDAPIVSDIRELTYEKIFTDADLERLGERRETKTEVLGRGGDRIIRIPRIDLLTGGFPCQPFSAAGKRGGREDDRFLWPEMVRCIQEFQPRWVVGENVAGIYSMEDVFEQVHTDLERCGYEVQAIRIPACAVGAHHRRDRWWFVAHAENKRRERGERGEDSTHGGRGGDAEPTTGGSGVPDWAGGSWPQPWPVSFFFDAANPAGPRLEGRERTEYEGRRNGSAAVRDGRDDWDADYGDERAESGIPTEIHDAAGVRKIIRQLPEWEQVWPPVGEFRRVASRLPAGLDGYTTVRNRTDRLKALGNAIVPQVAYEIFRAIQQVDT